MDFAEEFKKLVRSIPHNCVHSRAVFNCNFGDYIYRSKNAYLCWLSTGLEDCMYDEFTHKCIDCVDCSYLYASELCYECVDCDELYNCHFLQDCRNCVECFFGYDLINCKYCFGCIGLRNQNFCIFNKPYSEKIYKEKIKIYMQMQSKKVIETLRPEINRFPRLCARLLKGGENCVGDHIYFSKNCYQCFNVREMEDCGYIYDEVQTETPTKDSYDIDFSGGLELCYECSHSAFSHNSNFLESCTFCADSEYCIYCYNCRNCFFCAYLMNKEYCILNKPFQRDEYLKTVEMIKKELKAKGLYGKSLAEIIKVENLK